VKVAIKTRGRSHPTKGSRVRVEGLVYIVTHAEEPTELDDIIAVTDVELQPAGTVPGIPTLNAEIVCRAD
jgi:hypothetical protein